MKRYEFSVCGAGIVATAFGLLAVAAAACSGAGTIGSGSEDTDGAADLPEVSGFDGQDGAGIGEPSTPPGPEAPARSSLVERDGTSLGFRILDEWQERAEPAGDWRLWSTSVDGHPAHVSVAIVPRPDAAPTPLEAFYQRQRPDLRDKIRNRELGAFSIASVRDVASPIGPAVEIVYSAYTPEVVTEYLALLGEDLLVRIEVSSPPESADAARELGLRVLETLEVAE